jgi:hypothetical protein
MFSRSNAATRLELAFDRAIRELSGHEIGSEEYKLILDRAVTLQKLMDEEKPPAVSKDTLAVIGANLLGILMIIKHENLNVITSRAMNLIMKPRV